MRIRLAIPDRHVSAPVLDAALEATTRAARAQMDAGDAPTFSEMLSQGVRWAPERFSDGEHFDLPSIVGARGYGDCDDLAPALAAELRAYDPGAKARVIPSGPNRWHAIVQMSDGTLLDPSRMAGMRSRASVHGAITRPMALAGESAIAIMPHRGQWWARTDAPWDDGHLASLAADEDLLRAVDRSVSGAVSCGACAGWPTDAHLAVLGDLFGDLAEAGAGMIPGGTTALGLGKKLFGGGAAGAGAPMAALQSAQGMPLPNGGRATVCPSGPIIVRF